MSGILAGLRVIEGSAFVAAPLAGMTLAQMGAEVIRFDRPEGGLDHHRWPVNDAGVSWFWAGLNKGKKSVAVDLRSPEGRDLVTALITAPGDDAGVFLTNLRAKWMAYETLRARREDLIMVTVLGARDGGPAVDYTVNPMVGFPDATGPEGATDPVAHVLPAWDCICGQMAAVGLLAAERRRLRSGKGESVEIALKDVALAMLGNLGVIGEAAAGRERPKVGNALFGAYGQDFVCADGRRIMVVGLTEGQWSGLIALTETGAAMEALGARLGLDLSAEGDRFLARKEITAILAPWFAARSSREVGPLLDKARVAWGPFRTFRQALAEDPELAPGPLFSMVDHPGLGPVLTPGSPLSFLQGDAPPPGPAPRLGEHTEAVLADVLGLGSGAIGRLFDKGVVAGPR